MRFKIKLELKTSGKIATKLKAEEKLKSNAGEKTKTNAEKNKVEFVSVESTVCLLSFPSAPVSDNVTQCPSLV